MTKAVADDVHDVCMVSDCDGFRMILAHHPMVVVVVAVAVCMRSDPIPPRPHEVIPIIDLVT